MKLTPFLLIATTAAALADVRLPSIISDNMVLLQDAKANVWGWADAGEAVTVKLGERSFFTTADGTGAWSAKLEGLKPGVAGDMSIAGKNTLTVKNVAVGEVWLGSGQSNMEWPVAKSKDAEKEIAACNFPDIRVFTVARKTSGKPLEDVTGTWSVATPENAGKFSAVGYFFVRELHQKRKVPVGFIHSSWGGTPVESWMPESGMKSNPAFDDRWEEKRKESSAKADEPKVPQQKAQPHSAPMSLFNGMIAPLAPYTIRGVIWYQGEANAGPTKQGSMELYPKLFSTMIMAWRFEFARAQAIPREDGEFSFLYVQLANFMQRHEQPTDSYWAQIREAQLNTLEIPRTEMAVAIDIGEADDIHPKNKQEVGRRLALAALAGTYFEEIVYSGPIYAGMQVEDGKMRLNFSHAEGMKAKDGGKVKGFAIAGEDKVFHWAEVEIEGDHIVVSSAKVPSPIAVRYGWADNPDCNLVNAAELPASPFRSDDWKQNPPVNAPAAK